MEAEERMKPLGKRRTRIYPSVEQIVEKAMKPVERVDRSIMFQDGKDQELLGFYYDKFGVSKRDLNPFLNSLADGTIE